MRLPILTPSPPLLKHFQYRQTNRGRISRRIKTPPFSTCTSFLQVGWTPRLLLTEEINEDEKAEVASNLTHLRL